MKLCILAVVCTILYVEGAAVAGPASVEESCLGLDGKLYYAGESFPSTDGCNTCRCGPGPRTMCTKMYCGHVKEPMPVTCNVNGQVYQAGTSFKAADGCNTCYCNKGGNYACTKIGCMNVG